MNEISQTIEGYPTTLAAYTLSEKYNIEMPIVKATKSVLYDKQEPKLVINDLLSRTLQEEKINKSSWEMKINRFIKVSAIILNLISKISIMINNRCHNRYCCSFRSQNSLS